MSTILNLVTLESANESSTSPLYASLAKELEVAMMTDGAVHLLLCEGQDACPSSLVWNRIISGVKRALKALPDSLILSSTRDYRPAYRAKSPLFIVMRKAEYDRLKKAV